MNIAIIPARGGSKRIPGKNLRDFCGKPMIVWSIEKSRQSRLFQQVIVSTDCPRIAAVAEAHGATVPFLRPPHLSDDHTPTIPVIRHALQWLTEHDQRPDHVCCLYATAPFVQTEDLHRGWQALQSDDVADFAFAVTRFSFPIQRALRIENNRVQMLQPEHELTRSQDLPESWHDAGQFYWGTAQAFASCPGFFSAQSIPVILPGYRVQDIDTPEDWVRAESMFRQLTSQIDVA